MEYDSHLESFSATSKGQITSSALTINYCHGFREGLKILTSFAPINNHCRGLGEELETLNFSAPTKNHYCGLREELETQLVSTTSILFVSGSDILDLTLSSIEPSKTGYALWCGHCRRSEIMNLTPTICILYEYTRQVILCMVVIGKRWLDLDI